MRKIIGKKKVPKENCCGKRVTRRQAKELIYKKRVGKRK